MPKKINMPPLNMLTFSFMVLIDDNWQGEKLLYFTILFIIAS